MTGVVMSRRGRGGAAIVVVITTALFVARASRRDWITGDTGALVSGLPAISRCLRQVRLVDCNGLPGLHGAVSKFPLIQMVPAYVLHAGGLSDAHVIAGLIALNIVAVLCFSITLARWSYRRGGIPLATLAMLLLVPGLLLAYAGQSFGEALAAVAFGSAVLSA